MDYLIKKLTGSLFFISMDLQDNRENINWGNP